MKKNRVYAMSLASIYPHYITKAEKKGRSKEEVDQIICWLTGYDQKTLQQHRIICWLTGYSKKVLESKLKNKTDFETFFSEAPKLNPNRKLIKGVICGIRVEEIEEPIMQEIRYLDKLIDELARGKKMENILRK